MSRRYTITMDGIGIAKPTSVRAKAARSARWWSRRLGVDLAVVRMKGTPA